MGKIVRSLVVAGSVVAGFSFTAAPAGAVVWSDPETSKIPPCIGVICEQMTNDWLNGLDQGDDTSNDQGSIDSDTSGDSNVSGSDDAGTSNDQSEQDTSNGQDTSNLPSASNTPSSDSEALTPTIIHEHSLQVLNTPARKQQRGKPANWVQRVGMPAAGCEPMSEVTITGVASEWVPAWGEWLNNGEGGLACARTLTYTDRGWVPTETATVFSLTRSANGWTLASPDGIDVPVERVRAAARALGFDFAETRERA